MKFTPRYMVLATLLMLLFAGTHEVAAQTAAGWFTYPVDLATGVSVTPSITVRTNYPIDSASVTWEIPYDPDSVNVGIVFPTVILMDTATRSKITDSTFGGSPVNGTYTKLNDSTLQFVPHRLLYNATYSLRLKSLNVRKPRTGLPDTIVSVPETTIVFTTAPPPPRTVTSSVLPGSVVRCNEVAKITFCSELSSTTTAGGDIVELYEEVRDSLDSTGYSRVAITSPSMWLSPGNNAELNVSAPFIPGSHYTMVVREDLLTGDAADRYEVPFAVREWYKVTLDAMLLDTTGNMVHDPLLMQGIYPGTESIYLDYGDTVRPMASPTVDGYEFKYWLCIGGSLSGMTSPTPAFTVLCGDQSQEFTLTAIYERIPVEMVSISALPGGTVAVYDSENNLLVPEEGGYPLRRGDFITVVAKPGPGQMFASFVSTDPFYNGNTHPILVVHNTNGWSPDLDLDATFAALAPPGVCAFVAQMFAVSTTGVAANMVATMTPCLATDPTTHESFGTCGVVGAITVNVTNPQWEITTVRRLDFVGGQYVETLINVNGPFAMQTITETLPHTYVYFTLKPIERKLIVEKEFFGGGSLDMLKKVFVSVEQQNLIGPWQLSQQGSWTEYRFPEGTNLTLCAVPTGGFTFKEWASGAPYTDGNGATECFSLSLSGYNRHVKAIFNDAFVVTSIGIHDNPNDLGAVNWYDPQGFYLKENARILPDGPTPRAGTKVYLRFNKTVDRTNANYLQTFTVLGIPITVPRIRAFDESERIDNQDRRIYTAKATSTANTTWRTYNGIANSEVEFRLVSTNNVFIPKMEVFKIVVDQDLKSTSGLTIGNPDLWSVITEYPGVRVTFKSLMVHSRMGDVGKPDPYTSYVSGHSADFTTAEALVRKGKVPGGSATKLEKETWEDYDEVVLDIPKLQGTSRTRWALVTFDNDQNNYLTGVSSFLDELANGLRAMNLETSASVTVEKVGEFKVSAKWLELPAAIISGISQVAKSWRNEDDFMGQVEWFGNFSNHWGRRNTNEWQRRNSEATFKIEVVLDP